MINLRTAIRPALESENFQDDDKPLVPFEDVAGEDPMDHFEFELAPVAEAVAIESHRPFSRRRRISTEAARISMEEHGKGFWALLAIAVVAAFGFLGKMLGWFEGGSSGGGGGGGGGGSSSPIARVEAKIEKAEATVPKVIEAVEAVQELKRDPEVRKILTRDHCFEVFAETLSSGFTEYHRQLGVENSSIAKALKESATAVAKLGEMLGDIGAKTDAITDAWEEYFTKLENGEDVSNYAWQKAVDSCAEITDSPTGVYAPVGREQWQQSYSNLAGGAYNVKLELSEKNVTLGGDEAVKWFANFTAVLEKLGIQKLKEYIEESKGQVALLRAIEKNGREHFDEFFKKLDKNGADNIAWGSKAPKDQGRQLRGLLGISNNGDYDRWHGDLRRAQDATRAAVKAFLDMLGTSVRETGHLISIMNDSLDLYNTNRKALHRLVVQAKKDLTKANLPIPDDLEHAIQKTKD